MLPATPYSMLSDKEREYLQYFAREEYSGMGAIVDLGCWMGSSTVALADGVRQHSDLRIRAKRVHAYDIFLWQEWMTQLRYFDSTPQARYKIEDSFFDEFLRLTEPWKDNIEVHPGDLTAMTWSDGPIEFLFIDAMKSWDLAGAIIRGFYPAAMPGRSILVHQDFSAFAYWIHLTTYLFKDYFTPVYDIPGSGSFVFKYTAQIPPELLNNTYGLSCFSNQQIQEAFEYSRSLVPEEKYALIAASKVS
jgi:hypothetical protein